MTEKGPTTLIKSSWSPDAAQREESQKYFNLSALRWNLNHSNL